MSLSVGLSVSPALQTRPSASKASRAYLRSFIGFGLAGLLYSSFAWSVLLAGNGKSRVELALQLPLKGLIRFLEWIHCPDVVALVVAVFPPVTGLLCGGLALVGCWAWRALGLRWHRVKLVIAGIAFFEASLLGYGCANATLSEPGPRGYLAIGVRGDSLLALALTILFIGVLSLAALSPHWTPERRGATSAS
jgi:hypothetical protein